MVILAIILWAIAIIGAVLVPIGFVAVLGLMAYDVFASGSGKMAVRPAVGRLFATAKPSQAR